MPRQARKKSVTDIYHVMLRGADRRIIFSDDEDCLRFLDTLRRVKSESGFCLFAYCLMGNHVHLLIKEGREDLGQIFKRIGSSYVYYYNWKYQLHGHLFQDRYCSETVEDDPYFLDVIRYICQNPVKAGLVSSPFDYPWLGCGGISSEDELLDSFSSISDMDRSELMAFVTTPCREKHLDDTGMKRLTDAEAIKRLCESCGCNTVQEISGWPTKQRNLAICKASDSGISIRQLSRITAINKTTIENALRISRS